MSENSSVSSYTRARALRRIYSGIPDDLWRTVVKDVVYTREYPGYRYVYFTSEDDANEYLREVYGDNWRDGEWYKYYINTLRNEERSNTKNTSSILSIDSENNIYISKKNNYEALLSSILRSGYTELNEIYNLLLSNSNVKYQGESYSYKISKTKVKRFLDKYLKQNSEQKRTPKYILRSLIGLYADKSTRKIQELLKSEHGISLSHVRISEIKAEL